MRVFASIQFSFEAILLTFTALLSSILFYFFGVSQVVLLYIQYIHVTCSVWTVCNGYKFFRFILGKWKSVDRTFSLKWREILLLLRLYLYSTRQQSMVASLHLYFRHSLAKEQINFHYSYYLCNRRSVCIYVCLICCCVNNTFDNE